MPARFLAGHFLSHDFILTGRAGRARPHFRRRLQPGFDGLFAHAATTPPQPRPCRPRLARAATLASPKQLDSRRSLMRAGEMPTAASPPPRPSLRISAHLRQGCHVLFRLRGAECRSRFTSASNVITQARQPDESAAKKRSAETPRRAARRALASGSLSPQSVGRDSGLDTYRC